MLRWFHKFQSGKTDGPNSTLVRPTKWNEDHNAATTTNTAATGGIVVGRDNSGPGDLQELPLGFDAARNARFGSTGAMRPPAGTTAQRPAPPQPGDMRFNSETQVIEIYGLGGSTVWSQIPLGGMVPPGTLTATAALAVPAGWVYCDGQALSRATYAGLFAAIGTTWGPGDGSTTFNVPMLVDHVLVGAGSRYALSQQRGNVSYDLVVANDQLPSHRHVLTREDTGAPQGFEASINGGGGVTGSGNAMQSLGFNIVYTDYQSSGTGKTLTINTEQPGKGVYWMIKT